MVATALSWLRRGTLNCSFSKEISFFHKHVASFLYLGSRHCSRRAALFHGILPFHSRKKVASRRRIALRVHEMSLSNERARADGISLFRPFASLIVCSTNPGRSNQKEGAFIPLPPFFFTWRDSLQLEISITSLSISKLDYSFQPH